MFTSGILSNAIAQIIIIVGFRPIALVEECAVLLLLLGDRTVIVVGEDKIVRDEKTKRVTEARWILSRYDLDTGKKTQSDEVEGLLDGVTDILLAGKPCIAIAYK